MTKKEKTTLQIYNLIKDKIINYRTYKAVREMLEREFSGECFEMALEALNMCDNSSYSYNLQYGVDKALKQIKNK